MDKFSAGRDCNCPNARKEHLLVYQGKRYIMEPKINGHKNMEYYRLKHFFTKNSYRIKDHLSEVKENYETWKEI